LLGPSLAWHNRKRFLDFAENVHIGVFWAETTENDIGNLKKKFRREIWREI
jgi:hypothetical protein